MILIQNLKRIDAGTQKYIYEHPSDTDKIIKIMKPEHATYNGGRKGQHYLRGHHSGHIQTVSQRYCNIYSFVRITMVSNDLRFQWKPYMVLSQRIKGWA